MSYEFSASENEVMRRTGARTRTWGVLTVVGGVLTALMGVLAAIGGGTFGLSSGVLYLLLAALPVIIGRSFIRAGNALGRVVATQGSDVEHLMTSLEGLSDAFIIQIIAVSVWGVLLLIGIVLALAIPSFMR